MLIFGNKKPIARHNTPQQSLVNTGFLILLGVIGVLVIIAYELGKNIIVSWVVAMIVIIIYHEIYYVSKEKILEKRPLLLEQLFGASPSNKQITIPNSLRTLYESNPEFTYVYSDKDWRYADWRYTVNTKTRYGDYPGYYVYYSFFELDLSRELPNMLFDSKSSVGRQFGWKYNSSQKISLEGDFDRYFDTYVPDDYNIDALSIITPEVMQAMIELAKYDIEIFGDKLYVFGASFGIDDIKHILELAEYLRDMLGHNINTYKDTRISASISRHRIHSSGRVLNVTRISLWPFAIFAAILYLGWVQGVISKKEKYPIIILVCVTICILFTIAWEFYVNKKQRSE